jgi:hypothetical protein
MKVTIRWYKGFKTIVLIVNLGLVILIINDYIIWVNKETIEKNDYKEAKAYHPNDSIEPNCKTIPEASDCLYDENISGTSYVVIWKNDTLVITFSTTICTGVFSFCYIGYMDCLINGTHIVEHNVDKFYHLITYVVNGTYIEIELYSIGVTKLYECFGYIYSYTMEPKVHKEIVEYKPLIDWEYITHKFDELF